jgi:hypothetical protein
MRRPLFGIGKSRKKAGMFEVSASDVRASAFAARNRNATQLQN